MAKYNNYTPSISISCQQHVHMAYIISMDMLWELTNSRDSRRNCEKQSNWQKNQTWLHFSVSFDGRWLRHCRVI